MFVVWISNCEVTSIENDVITYTPYEGLNYTTLDKIKPLWKRIGELPDIQMGCYRGDPGQQRHLGGASFAIRGAVNGVCVGLSESDLLRL